MLPKDLSCIQEVDEINDKNATQQTINLQMSNQTFEFNKKGFNFEGSYERPNLLNDSNSRQTIELSRVTGFY